jgi:hypothetical protein
MNCRHIIVGGSLGRLLDDRGGVVGGAESFARPIQVLAEPNA